MTADIVIHRAGVVGQFSVDIIVVSVQARAQLFGERRVLADQQIPGDQAAHADTLPPGVMICPRIVDLLAGVVVVDQIGAVQRSTRRVALLMFHDELHTGGDQIHRRRRDEDPKKG